MAHAPGGTNIDESALAEFAKMSARRRTRDARSGCQFRSRERAAVEEREEHCRARRIADECGNVRDVRICVHRPIVSQQRFTQY